MNKNKAVRVSSFLLASALSLVSMPTTAATAAIEGVSETLQSQKIKGKIVDAKTGEPLIGANVKVKGTKAIAVSDINGEFSIDAKAGATLVVSSIGYKQAEATAANGKSIRMFEDDESLDEVIVVGYTTQKKESLTGAMANVKGDKLRDITTPSVENMLNGKVAGVYVAPGSGQPGSSGAVIIRGQVTLNGSTSPLWVIDGVIVGNSAGQLNPNDVESMTVLKDAASTAIYGSEGANGVIVVTTKNAKGEKFTAKASAKMGISTLNNGNVEMMNGQELYDYYSSYQNADQLSAYSWWTSDLRNRNFDWWDLATKTGFTQDYNVSISGGSEKMQSYFSVGYYDEDGAVRGYDYQRYNATLKTTFKPTKWLTIKPTITGSRRDVNDKQYSVTAMYKRLPWDSPYDSEGNLEPDRSSNWIDGSETNYLLDLSYGNYSEETHYEVRGNLDFDVKFTDWLTFSSVNSYYFTHNSSHSYTDPRSGDAQEVQGRLTEWRSEVVRRYTNQKLLFNKRFGLHNVSGLLAYEFKDYTYKYIDVYGTGFVPGFEVLDVVAVPEQTAGNRSESAKQSYFTQWKYDYDNRYLAEFMIRRDGASNFGDNAKYGNFFSVSAGWNINRESWFKADWVDALKIRASFGSVGNPPSALYPQYDLYSVGVSYNEVPGALISQVGNKGLTWEKTYTTDLGIDAMFFQNRLRFNFDFYVKNTDNILYKVPVTGLTGVTSIWRNIGKMRNTGIDISLGGDIIRTKDWLWSVDANLSHNSNELRDLYKQMDENGNYVVRAMKIGDGSGIAGSASRLLEVGEPVDTYYMREWAGVNPDNGLPMWYKNDENGNKVTTSNPSEADYYKCGKREADFYGSLNTYLSYKNFDLSAVFGYSVGGQIYNYSRLEYDSDGAYGDRNQMKLQKDWSRWEKPGDKATHPRAYYNNSDQGNIASSRYLESSDFLKMRSLTIGYNFSLPQYGLHNARVYFSAENLFTITDYSGVDPELPAGTDSVTGQYTVLGTAGASVYPSVRKFMIGLDLTF